MGVNQDKRPTRRWRSDNLVWLTITVLLAAGSFAPTPGPRLLVQVGSGVLTLLPVIALSALIAGGLAKGRWSQRTMAWIRGNNGRAVFFASLVGAATPVCGLGVLPLIASLLRRGLPLPPVMAFWVSSPIMGPSMAVMTVGIIGLDFAVAKLLAAIGTGLLAGAVTTMVFGLNRRPERLLRLEYPRGGTRCRPDSGFWTEVAASVRMILRWLVLALVLEVYIQQWLPANWIQGWFSQENPGSVVLAALVGAPLYLDGYAALPLVRTLIDMGMSYGSALAIMVSGAAVSLYAAVAVAAVVRPRVFLLYVALAVAGACVAGYLTDLVPAMAGVSWPLRR